MARNSKPKKEKGLFQHYAGGNWYFQFVIAGRRFAGTTETKDVVEARKVRDRLRAMETAKATMAKAAMPKRGEPRDAPMLQVALHYIEELRNANRKLKVEKKKKKSSEDRKKYIGWIVREIGAETLVSTVDDTVAIAIRNARTAERHHRTGKPLSNATINRTAVEPLRCLLAHARRKMKIRGLPEIDWRDVKMSEAGARIRYLSYDEQVLLEDNIREGYGACYRFALLSGLRFDNFCNLRWKEVDLGSRFVSVTQKADKAHLVPLTDEMVGMIEAQRGFHPEFVFTFVFAGSNGGGDWDNPSNGGRYIKGHRYPVTPGGFKTWFVRLKARLEIKDLRIHDLRKTAGGRAATEASLREAKELLGHSSIVITERHYARLVALAPVREALEKASIREKTGLKDARQRLEMGKVTQKVTQSPVHTNFNTK